HVGLAIDRLRLRLLRMRYDLAAILRFRILDPQFAISARPRSKMLGQRVGQPLQSIAQVVLAQRRRTAADVARHVATGRLRRQSELVDAMDRVPQMPFDYPMDLDPL